jgi:hypothetical protein
VGRTLTTRAELLGRYGLAEDHNTLVDADVVDTDACPAMSVATPTWEEHRLRNDRVGPRLAISDAIAD